MAYADLLSDEGIESQYLCVLKPRRRVESWALVSGTIYRAAFDFGYMFKIVVDGIEKDEATDSTLADGGWYLDFENGLLYLDIGGDPASNYVVGTYEIHISTDNAYWYRDPSDTRLTRTRLITDHVPAPPLGNRYKVRFDLDSADGVTIDGRELPPATSPTLFDGEWYLDSENDILYFEFDPSMYGDDPNTSIVIVSYTLTPRQSDSNWYRADEDGGSIKVHYNPIISKVPSIKIQNNDLLQGFLPTSASNLVLNEAAHIMQRHVYDSSFYLAEVEIYHWLDELKSENLSLVFRGLCGNPSFADTSVSIRMFDRNRELETEIRNIVSQLDGITPGVSFWPLSSTVEPELRNRPIRRVYGIVDTFRLVNLDYNVDSPTTSNNRLWGCWQASDTSSANGTAVPSAPASTATRTYLNGKIARVGDYITNLNTDDFFEVIAIGVASGKDYVEHSAVTPASPFENILRSLANRVTLVQDGAAYILKPTRDYTFTRNTPDNTMELTLTSSAESNVGASTFNPSSDLIYCRAYGPRSSSFDIFPQLKGAKFGSDSDDSLVQSNGIVILYSLLRMFAGIPESEIDVDTFESLEATLTTEVGFAIPEDHGANFPRVRQSVNDVCRSLLLQIFLDSDGKWSLAEIGPAGSADKTVDDEEILSISQSFDYDDILSDIFIKAGKGDVNRDTNELSGDWYVISKSATSDNALYVHKIKRQKTFKTLHSIESEAQTYADRLAFILGERRGVLSFSAKHRFFDTEIGDITTVSRPRLPGFEFDSSIDRTRDYAIRATDKNLNRVKIELDDQKGIEDNSGSW